MKASIHWLAEGHHVKRVDLLASLAYFTELSTSVLLAMIHVQAIYWSQEKFVFI